MLVPHGTLILIVDSSGFRLLRNRGSDASLVLECLESGEREDGGSAELPAAPERAEPGSKRAHDRSVADLAYDLIEGQSDAPAIVVAPPRMLGAIRGQYSDAFRSRLISDFDKDFIHQTPGAVAQFLQHVGE